VRKPLQKQKQARGNEYLRGDRLTLELGIESEELLGPVLVKNGEICLGHAFSLCKTIFS